jgi:hypothetical protein
MCLTRPRVQAYLICAVLNSALPSELYCTAGATTLDALLCLHSHGSMGLGSALSPTRCCFACCSSANLAQLATGKQRGNH